MIRFAFVSTCLLLSFTFAAPANPHCRQRVVVKQDAVAVAVVPAVATIVLPAYSAGYAPQAEDPGTADKIQKLQEQLDRIERLLSGNGGKPVVAQAQPNKGTVSDDQKALSAMFGLVKRSCAACHSDTTAASLGGNFIMLRGNSLVKPSDKRAHLMLTRTFDPASPDVMPPPSAKKKHGIDPLTDQDFATLIKGVEVLMSR